MAQVRIWVHAVWSTKNRTPLLANKNKRIDIFKHIKANAKEKGIYLGMGLSGCLGEGILDVMSVRMIDVLGRLRLPPPMNQGVTG